MAKPKTPKPTASQYTAPDSLSREEIAQQYGYALKVIYSNPEIQSIFEQAVNQGWTKELFQAKLQASKFWQDNNEYYRKAWTAEQMGGADWEAQKENAKIQVQDAAKNIGRNLTPAELDNYARRYLYEGWGQSSRGALMAKALSEGLKAPEPGQYMEGGAGDLQETLMKEARRNGLRFSESFYQSAAQSVAGGLRTADDFRRDIREQAAGKWPIFADQIRGGMDAQDLASAYIETMAQEFEIDPQGIDLNDPYIMQALAGYDEKGQPKAMSLWDFQRKLRNDPRWMNTGKAQNEVTTVAGRVMQMFGLMGG